MDPGCCWLYTYTRIAASHSVGQGLLISLTNDSVYPKEGNTDKIRDVVGVGGFIPASAKDRYRKCPISQRPAIAKDRYRKSPLSQRAAIAKARYHKGPLSQKTLCHVMSRATSCHD
jgi:hypothetical protein